MADLLDDKKIPDGAYNLQGIAQSSEGGSVSNLLQNFFSPPVGGNRTYYQNLPLLLRGSKYATVVSKANRTIQAMPRQRFLFFANFNPNPLTKIRDMSSLEFGFAFQLSKVDRPKTSPEVQRLHQYNRTRLVHKGVKFEPMNLTFHDTVDDRVLRVWNQYYNWYFGEGRNAGTTPRERAYDGAVITPKFEIDSGWGFSPQTDVGRYSNFFDSLDIYTFYGKRYTKIRVYNPKIASIDFEQLDTESSALSTGNISIQHEGYSYVAVGEAVSGKEISLFGLNRGDYYEPADAFGGLNTYLLGISDQLEAATDNLLQNVSGIPFVGQALAGQAGRFIASTGVTGYPTKLASRISASSLGKWGNFF